MPSPSKSVGRLNDPKIDAAAPLIGSRVSTRLLTVSSRKPVSGRGVSRQNKTTPPTSAPISATPAQRSRLSTMARGCRVYAQFAQFLRQSFLAVASHTYLRQARKHGAFAPCTLHKRPVGRAAWQELPLVSPPLIIPRLWNVWRGCRYGFRFIGGSADATRPYGKGTRPCPNQGRDCLIFLEEPPP